MIRQKTRENAYLFQSALLGLSVFLLIYGAEPLRVSGIGWLLKGYGGDDITQHQTGWMFFRNSPWTFPFGKALNLGWPEGTSVSYTDSIPIAALFFKLLSGILPRDFQYFGLFTALCFSLQGLFAALLVFQFTGNRKYAVLSSLLFVFATGFIERAFRQSALSAHWLILAGLCLYFAENPPVLFPILLNVLAIGIHPYLFAMVFALTFASEIRRCRKNGKLLTGVRRVGAVITIVLIFGFLIGLFGNGSGIQPESGYGYYSLNLNALLNPAVDFLSSWSRWMPALSRTPEQKDGSFYFGIPAALSLLLVLLLFRGKLIPAIYKYPEMAVLSLLFTVFAVSNRVTFGNDVIFKFHLAHSIRDLFNIFRAGSRFFYVPYYLLYFMIAAGFYRAFRKKAAFAIMAILIGLQIWEITPGLMEIKEIFSKRVELPELSSIWETASDYQELRTFENLNHRPLAFWTARQGMRTNMMISAPIHQRYYNESVRAEKETLYRDLLNGEPLEADILYVISNETGSNRILETPESLDELINALQTNYADCADLEYATDGFHNYWLLMPNKSGK